MSNSDEAREAVKARWRSPYLLWLVWIVWLPFLVPPTIGQIQAHPAWPRLVITLIGVAVFVGLYLWATLRNAQRLITSSSPTEHTVASKWLPIAILTMLSLAIALLGYANGSELLTPFLFTSAYVAGRLPTVRAVQVNGALTLLAGAVGWLTSSTWFDLGQGVFLFTVISFTIISLVRSIIVSRELRAAREEIARLAVMTERLRIARDLHDLLGHNLSLIALKSELARRLVGVAPERASVEIDDVEHVARTTLQEIREAVASYRQPTLSSELHGAQEILAAAGIAYRFEGDESIMGTLPTAIEAVLAWTVREGVTNVIRHSRAHQCTIHVSQERHTACVEVIDDGASSTSQAQGSTSTNGTGSGGNGLRGLAERVEALGGQFEAGPRVGGYRLAVSVPLLQRNSTTGTPGTAAASHTQRAPVVAQEQSNSYAERREQV